MVRLLHGVSLSQSSTISPKQSQDPACNSFTCSFRDILFARALSMRSVHEEYDVAAAQGDGLPGNRSGSANRWWRDQQGGRATIQTLDLTTLWVWGEDVWSGSQHCTTSSRLKGSYTKRQKPSRFNIISMVTGMLMGWKIGFKTPPEQWV